MSIHSATEAASSTIRRYVRPVLNWRVRSDSPYSATSCLALLLIVGLAVKLGH